MWEELSFNHFLKHSNHLKKTQEIFLNGTMCSGYSSTFKLLISATTVAKISIYSTITSPL